MDYDLKPVSAPIAIDRVVGHTDITGRQFGVADNLTRWSRIVGHVFAGGEQWYFARNIATGQSDLIRAKRIHTIMPDTY